MREISGIWGIRCLHAFRSCSASRPAPACRPAFTLPPCISKCRQPVANCATNSRHSMSTVRWDHIMARSQGDGEVGSHGEYFFDTKSANPLIHGKPQAAIKEYML
ncbi:hypothetical protein Desti_0726 [Desulfomonile tiedjei DSM 6799]|uniref:Uncharacterized protein n=1 Tax=Desulfomonile tiedjei (strain ATCC 49306 / DSM 6799 / DCB-1) TaxID=706587 RepID=I4C1L1_DESTA|nr:hypothetical protein Desti_0726 [Desulfomonile tiedjei DSM 6799]